MKKFLFVLFGFYCFSAFSQTVLSSHYLSLKKPLAKQQFLTAVNSSNQQVFVFAADKEIQTGYRYNSALFYKDSITAERPEQDEYATLSGYSFDAAGNPDIYWASDNYKKILAVHYDFETGQVSNLPYAMDFSAEELINSFSENNIFYLITSEKAKP